MIHFIRILVAVTLVGTQALAMGSPLPEESVGALDMDAPVGLFLDPSQMSVNLQKYDHLDPQNIVPTTALKRAVQFYDLNKAKIKNRRYITIMDFSKRATQKRMFLVDMTSGAVRTFMVAVGRGSDPDGDGSANRFSNVAGSNKSSLGFYLTGGLYNGGNGRSMQMHGLETTNSNALSRYIVMHGADYVTSSRAGRSQGCPAIEQKYVNDLLPKLMGGSLIYHHFNQK